MRFMARFVREHFWFGHWVKLLEGELSETTCGLHGNRPANDTNDWWPGPFADAQVYYVDSESIVECVRFLGMLNSTVLRPIPHCPWHASKARIQVQLVPIFDKTVAHTYLMVENIKRKINGFSRNQSLFLWISFDLPMICCNVAPVLQNKLMTLMTAARFELTLAVVLNIIAMFT